MKHPHSSQINIANYGTWLSPISAEAIAAGETSIINMHVDGEATYWCEMRPKNHGRYTIVRSDAQGNVKDVTPPDFNVRTFVHEYGGGAFAVSNGLIYASSAANHAIYTIKPGSPPVQLTSGQERLAVEGLPKWKGTRFGDLHPTKHGLIAVGEHHEPGRPVENFLALIDTKTGTFKKLASGFDFYSSPAISSDGKKIAWVCWNQPEMPWTNTALFIGELDEQGNIINSQQVAGNIPESILQPLWADDGSLYFISDRDRGWWNIHRYSKGRIENICPMEAEVGEPLWVLDRSVYALLGSKIVFAYNQNGLWKLGLLDLKTKQWQKISSSGSTIGQIRSGKGFVRYLEYYQDKPVALIQLDDAQGYPVKKLHSEAPTLEEGCISRSVHVSYPSNGRTAYGLYYPPRNNHLQAPAGTKPPLVVMIHGGPTAQARNHFQLKMQYWTTRGFAVLDVNYGGSTGYGRKYRNLLNLNWGIVDVEDCVNGAKYLVDQGLVDPEQLVIRGGSAGGYTTLAALAFKNTFKAGASYYGVADITALAQDTHKFEARYLELLVGKYPEEKKIWEERSPINSANTINSPLIIFQGEDDAVVPKNQSIMIYEALKKRGVPVEIYIYPGEEHGFRQAENIIDSIKKETEFYLKVFGLIQNIGKASR